MASQHEAQPAGSAQPTPSPTTPTGPAKLSPSLGDLKSDEPLSRIAPRQPGRPLDVRVRIQYVDDHTGFGVFAARDFQHKEVIFKELPIITAIHDSYHEVATKDVYKVYLKELDYKKGKRRINAMHGAFPAFGGTVGLSAEECFDYVGLLGCWLYQDQQIELAFTPDEYMQVCEPKKIEKIKKQGPETAVLEFFRHYAFRVCAKTRLGCVYLIGSLINHTCSGRNAKVFINPHNNAMEVTAWLGIKEGEEIRISYDQESKLFECTCPACPGHRSFIQKVKDFVNKARPPPRW